MKPALACAMALSVMAGGCSTVATMTGGGEPAHLFGPYSGAQRDFDIAFSYSGCKSFPLFGILDFPFSLTLDTVVLPVSFFVWLFRDNPPADEPEPAQKE